ncbi:MAG: response regulator [Chthoniobacter sp.]|nr:response regulator [Chthoniobacter sp.]
MTNKRILLVHEDQLLGNMYRERLEHSGFAVEATRSGEAALRAIAERPPDLVVLDAVTPDPAPARLIATLRAGESTRTLPVVVLPTARGQLAEAAQTAGATRVLKRTANPMADLMDAVETTFGLQPAILSKSLPFRPDQSWITMGLDSAPETITILRRSLQALSRDANDTACLRELFQRIHALTEQMAMLGQKPLFTFASAVEALAFDLLRMPTQINASTIRTLGQSLDLLATLVQEPQRSRVQDPAYGQVLVVDDEDGVARLIQAAMRLVNLEATTAATPTAGLTALAARPFDMVFFDIGLPEMSGFDLCTRARALPLHQKTPIVFITGMDTLGNRVQSNLSGGNDFVGKPFNVVELGLKALLWVYKGQLGLV